MAEKQLPEATTYKIINKDKIPSHYVFKLHSKEPNSTTCPKSNNYYILLSKHKGTAYLVWYKDIAIVKNF